MERLKNPQSLISRRPKRVMENPCPDNMRVEDINQFDSYRAGVLCGPSVTAINPGTKGSGRLLE